MIDQGKVAGDLQVSREIMDKFKGKEKVSETWKKDLSAWEEHRNVKACGAAMRRRLRPVWN